jgi:hypothetical protein
MFGHDLCLRNYQACGDVQAWSIHPGHVRVKKTGREKFYPEYRVQVCELGRESKFRA